MQQTALTQVLIAAQHMAGQHRRKAIRLTTGATSLILEAEAERHWAEAEAIGEAVAEIVESGQWSYETARVAGLAVAA